MTSFGNHRHHSVHSRSSSGGLGLSSLGATLDKLSQDKDRSSELLQVLAGKMKMVQTVTQHKNLSFANSGYVFVSELGQGRFGCVKLAKKKANEYVTFTNKHKPDAKRSSVDHTHSSFVAVRVIPRYKVRNGRLTNNEVLASKESHATLMKQISALRALDHPNICREYETFEDSQNIHIIMEYCSGGSLMERALSGHNPISQDLCMHYIRQIVSAMAHAHEKHIIHQDLQPKVILFATPDADARLVVTDWNYAEFMDAPLREARRFLPESDFSAPELAVRNRTSHVDIWSIGAIAFAMLTYRLPYDGPVEGPVQWAKEDEVSQECKELVNSMLQKEPTARPSAKDLLLHPLLKFAAPKADHPEMVVDIGKAFVSFSQKSRLQKTAATFAAAHLSGEKLHELSQLFLSLDTNGDGTLDLGELGQAFEKLDLSEGNSEKPLSPTSLKRSETQRLAVMLHAMDTDGTGHISYSEFLSAAADSAMQSSVQLAYEAFRAFDFDGSGLINRHEIDRLMSSKEISELLEAIKLTKNKEAIEQAMSMIGGHGHDLDSKQILGQLDKDGNENVSFDEFLQAILGTPDGTEIACDHPMLKEVEENRKKFKPPPQKIHTDVSANHAPGAHLQAGRFGYSSS